MTVTVKVQTVALLLASLAVLVTEVMPTGKAKPLGGTLVTVGAPQLSVALTMKVTLLVHWPGAALTVRLAGHKVKVGGVMSRTMTCCRQELLLPLPSVAVQITKLVP